jgi:hypothetical protein|tara:strand:- start:107 stop:286 length:180 start_codon:yes stop_codon:yes gene_type:complete
MDGIILVAIMVVVFIAVCQMIFTVSTGTGGTKGISKEAYYGKKTGKQYTAEKTREHHIV